MQSEKVALIKLGGKIHENRPTSSHESVHKSSDSKDKASSCHTSQLNDSKERIQSNQRISHKISPIKRKQIFYRNQRYGQGCQAAHSSNQAQSSTISLINQSTNNPNMRIHNRNCPQAYQPTGHLLKVNFVKNCFNGQKTLQNYLNLRELNTSPSKIILSSSKTSVMESRQAQLERKIKILENRVGEIHKQKHQMMGKLNQENRKIYHQNTVLKLKINDLCKQLEIMKKQSKTWQLSGEECFRNDSYNSLDEVQCLKRQIQECKNLLEQQSSRHRQLVNKYLSLEEKLKQKQQDNRNLKTQIIRQKDLLAIKNVNIEQIQKAYEMAIASNIQHQRIKKDFQNDIESIRLKMVENNQRNRQIIQGYKFKLNQYQLAYNQNQQVIQQLTQTIAYLQTQPDKFEEKHDQAEKGQQAMNEVQNECQLLEHNLRQALQERDQTIKQLQINLGQIQSEYEQKCFQFQQLIAQNQQRQQKLKQISFMLEKYNDKFRQMERRYQQLSLRYESEKQKLVKADNHSLNQRQKCKKCDQLLKTIFRLNSLLNAKRSQ